jgi:KTSC domain
MRRHAVESSSISSVGYNAASKTLEVEFHNGSLYRYYDVPQSVYDAWMAAPSKGQFFTYQIRDRFPFSQL